eukprot:SAG11_NODE_1463_length_4863_cov_15.348657_1_plen_378_part_00
MRARAEAAATRDLRVHNAGGREKRQAQQQRVDGLGKAKARAARDTAFGLALPSVANGRGRLGLSPSVLRGLRSLALSDEPRVADRLSHLPDRAAFRPHTPSSLPTEKNSLRNPFAAGSNRPVWAPAGLQWRPKTPDTAHQAAATAYLQHQSGGAGAEAGSRYQQSGRRTVERRHNNARGPAQRRTDGKVAVTLPQDLQARIAKAEPAAVESARTCWALQQEVRQLRQQIKASKAAMEAEATQLEQHEILKTFGRIDLDNSGTIDREELRKLASDLGHTLDEAGLDSAMNEMDFDGSGEVDLAEFQHWWQLNKENSAGLFGSLFGNTLMMSDSYLQLTIGLRKKEAALRLVRPLRPQHSCAMHSMLMQRSLCAAQISG